MNENKTYTCYDFFKSGVFFSQLNIDLNKLLKFCHSYKKDFRQLSNLCGIQSNNLDLKLPILRPLLNNIYEIGNDIAKSTYKINQELMITNMWFNINKYKDSNASHTHPFSVLSGVFYVQAPKDCGELIIVNPSKISHFTHDNSFFEYNQYNSTSNFITPKENILIIFPSWLEHFVKPNMSKSDRISFSFNLNFKK